MPKRWLWGTGPFVGIALAALAALAVRAAGAGPEAPARTGPGSETGPRTVLWYDTPAVAFESALPLGNGRIGAMVYGDAGGERFLLNEATLWAGGPIDPMVNPDAISHLPRVRAALFRRDYRLADELTRKMQGRFSQSYAPLGDLYVEMSGRTSPAALSIRRELDIGTAVATTTVGSGPAAVVRESSSRSFSSRRTSTTASMAARSVVRREPWWLLAPRRARRTSGGRDASCRRRPAAIWAGGPGTR